MLLAVNNDNTAKNRPMQISSHFNGYDIHICPSDQLAGYVTCYIEAEGAGTHDFLRRFPALQFGLVFNLQGSGLSVSDRKDNHYTSNDLFFVGANTGYLDLHMKGRLHAFYIVFHEYMPRLFGQSPADFTDSVVHAGAVDKNVRSLHERLLAAKDFPGRVRLAESFLRHKIYKAALSPDPLAAYVRNKIEMQPHLAIKSLEQATGYSIRRLEQKFREQTGVSMQRYQQIVRMRHTILHLKQDPGKDLLSVALDFGFYDLAYFGKMFKQCTGFSPSAFNTSRLFHSPVQNGPSYLL